MLMAEHELYPKVLSEFVADDQCAGQGARARWSSRDAERLSHGQPTFVAGKQFAQFRANHHGDTRTVVCVRTSGLDEQAMLLESDPEAYSKPAYLHPRDGSRSTSAAKRIGTMSQPYRKAGSLRRRGACWKQADDDVRNRHRCICESLLASIVAYRLSVEGQRQTTRAFDHRREAPSHSA